MSSMFKDSVYQGTFKPSPNIRNYGQDEIYKVGIQAKGLRRNETPSPGLPLEGVSFSVQAPKPPPPQPYL